MSARTQSPALAHGTTRSGIDVRLTRRAVVEAAALGVSSAAIAVALSGIGLALGAGLAVLIAALALGSSFLHEFAHLRTATRRGLRVLSLEITGALAGGVTREVSTRPRTEIAVCLAGPAATLGLVLASVAGLIALSSGPPLGRSLALTMLTLNVTALVGTLPILSGSDISRAWAAWRIERAAST